MYVYVCAYARTYICKDRSTVTIVRYRYRYRYGAVLATWQHPSLNAWKKSKCAEESHGFVYAKKSSTMNEVFRSAANEARQKLPQLTSNQEVSWMIISSIIYVCTFVHPMILILCCYLFFENVSCDRRFNYTENRWKFFPVGQLTVRYF